MRALLLPIKDLRNAKQRLAGVLTVDERRGLAQAMRRVLAHPEEAQARARAGRALIEREFDIELSAERMLAVFGAPRS